VFRYILRFGIQPGFHEDRRLETLIEFCKEASIDEVMFFIGPEELNSGHLTKEEAEPWLEGIAKAKRLLDPIGIKTSINPWATLLHTDRGRRLKSGQNFTLMVDPYGNRASAVACPLCENWRRYIVEMFSLYASIRPYMIWIEDDFRLHNHEPLIWGGCFCELHMKEFSRRAGKILSREEFVEGILRPGDPHPYRKVWLDVCRETMIELAKIISDAVHKVSPETYVGLMSSDPEVHCIEGRDWHGILDNLATQSTPSINRPHLPSYTEVTPQVYIMRFNAVSRLTKTFIPDHTMVYPELENFPFSLFSKSKAFTRFQLETSSVLDSDGITLDIFDIMGNGILLRDGYQDILSSSKNFINAIKTLGINFKRQYGVKVLVDPNSSYTINTYYGRSMDELRPRETFWAQLFSAYSITNIYDVDKDQKDSVVAISGQYLRNLSKGQIYSLFKNNFVMLEGEAIWTLYYMGYGDLIGIMNIKLIRHNTGIASYEQVCDNNKYYGIEEARMSSQNTAGDIFAIEYKETPDILSLIKDPYGNTVANGMAVYKGKAFIFPYGFFDNDFTAHRNPIRQEIVQKILEKYCYGQKLTFVRNLPYVGVFDYELEDKRVMVLVNASGDDIHSMRIYAPCWDKSELQKITKEQIIPAKANMRADRDDIILEEPLDRLGLMVLIGSK